MIARYDRARDVAKDAQRVKDLQTISEALEKYYLKNNKYPSSLDDPDFKSTFLSTIPTDPDAPSAQYSYCVDATYQKYALMAKLKTKSQALETDYDKDWPDSGNCDCNPTGEVSDPENSSPYTYCIKNP